MRMWPVSGRGARDARAAGASGTATAGDDEARAHSGEDASPHVPAPVQRSVTSTVADPGWRGLAPMRPSLAPMRPISSMHFAEDLSAWKDPTVALSPLSHARGTGPSGEADGIATLREPIAPATGPLTTASGPSLDLRTPSIPPARRVPAGAAAARPQGAVPAPTPEPAGRAVQRVAAATPVGDVSPRLGGRVVPLEPHPALAQRPQSMAPAPSVASHQRPAASSAAHVGPQPSAPVQRQEASSLPLPAPTPGRPAAAAPTPGAHVAPTSAAPAASAPAASPVPSRIDDAPVPEAAPAAPATAPTSLRAPDSSPVAGDAPTLGGALDVPASSLAATSALSPIRAEPGPGALVQAPRSDLILRSVAPVQRLRAAAAPARDVLTQAPSSAPLRAPAGSPPPSAPPLPAPAAAPAGRAADPAGPPPSPVGLLADPLRAPASAALLGDRPIEPVAGAASNASLPPQTVEGPDVAADLTLQRSVSPPAEPRSGRRAGLGAPVDKLPPSVRPISAPPTPAAVMPLPLPVVAAVQRTASTSQPSTTSSPAPYPPASSPRPPRFERLASFRHGPVPVAVPVDDVAPASLSTPLLGARPITPTTDVAAEAAAALEPDPPAEPAAPVQLLSAIGARQIGRRPADEVARPAPSAWPWATVAAPDRSTPATSMAATSRPVSPAGRVAPAPVQRSAVRSPAQSEVARSRRSGPATSAAPDAAPERAFPAVVTPLAVVRPSFIEPTASVARLAFAETRSASVAPLAAPVAGLASTRSSGTRPTAGASVQRLAPSGSGSLISQASAPQAPSASNAPPLVVARSASTAVPASPPPGVSPAGPLVALRRVPSGRVGAELLALATPRAEAARQSAPPMVPVQTIRAAAPLPVPVPAAPRPTPANPVVQRSMLGDVFQGGQSSFGDSIGSMFGKKKREAMSEEEIRTLANRIYPYISQRLKVELRRDRERAGMITGLHQ